MTITEFLEKDKERLVNDLSLATTTEKAEAVIRSEVDRLLLLYNEQCEEPQGRATAAAMLQTARYMTSLLGSWGHVRIWEEIAGTGKTTGGMTLKEKLLAILCGLCLLGGFLFAVLSWQEKLQVSNLLLALLLLAAGAVFAWLGGRISGKRTGAKPIGKNEFLLSEESGRYQTQIRVDAQKAYMVLHHMASAADHELEQLADRASDPQTSSAVVLQGALSEEECTLYAGLLEAANSKDGDYALDCLNEVSYYLHRRGIEIVSFDGSNPQLFDFMPSRKKQTIRPALLYQGKVLKRGLAAGER